MVQLQCEALVSIQIGNKTYYDDSNGIMNSLSPIHRVCVPMEVLDQEKQYTVCIRPIVERKPYFTETKEPVVYRFAFAPVPEKNIRVYHISDAHNAIDMPVKAAKAFMEQMWLDFLYICINNHLYVRLYIKICKKCIKKAEVVAYDDLGAEAIRRLEVVDLPAIVVIDSCGNNLYEIGRKNYLAQKENNN